MALWDNAMSRKMNLGLQRDISSGAALTQGMDRFNEIQQQRLARDQLQRARLNESRQRLVDYFNFPQPSNQSFLLNPYQQSAGGGMAQEPFLPAYQPQFYPQAPPQMDMQPQMSAQVQPIQPQMFIPQQPVETASAQGTLTTQQFQQPEMLNGYNPQMMQNTMNMLPQTMAYGLW